MSKRLIHIDKIMPEMFTNLSSEIQSDITQNNCLRCDLPFTECSKTGLEIMYVDLDTGTIWWCFKYSYISTLYPIKGKVPSNKVYKNG